LKRVAIYIIFREVQFLVLSSIRCSTSANTDQS